MTVSFKLAHLPLWLVLLAGIAATSGCRVNAPGAGDTLSEPYATDRVPDATDVPFGPAPLQPQQLLDVYEAQGTSSGIAIIFVHVGAWAAGDKSDAQTTPLLQYFMDQGHVVFSINYTLAEPFCLGPSPFPDNVNDVKWAIAWANMAAQKSTYNYDKVAVMGASAGGQLALYAATTGNIRPLDMPQSHNPRPDAGLSFGAPSNMVTWGAQGTAAQQAAQQNVFGLNPVQCFWGQGFEHPDDVPLLARLIATAAEFVDSGDPPIYMASSVDDALALAEHNADVLEQAYVDIGSGFGLAAWNDRVPGTSHNMDYIANRAAVDLFLQLVADDVL